MLAYQHNVRPGMGLIRYAALGDSAAAIRRRFRARPLDLIDWTGLMNSSAVAVVMNGGLPSSPPPRPQSKARDWIIKAAAASWLTARRLPYRLVDASRSEKKRREKETKEEEEDKRKEKRPRFLSLSSLEESIDLIPRSFEFQWRHVFWLLLFYFINKRSSESYRGMPTDITHDNPIYHKHRHWECFYGRIKKTPRSHSTRILGLKWRPFFIWSIVYPRFW